MQIVHQNLEVNDSFPSSTKLISYLNHSNVNLPWLQLIPSHWRIYRGKIFLESIDQRSTTGNEELLTVSSKFGIIPRKDAKVTMFKAESYVGYKLCWPNDLVINSLWAWANGLGVSKYHGIVSSAYGIYRVTKKDLITPKYLHLLVRSSQFQWELQYRSKGIWTSRLQLTDESFLNAPFPLPPLEEQNAIVRFLDYTDRRIKRYIRAKQKLIKLLEEEKQAIIHQAVTHGLNPDVPVKPSGVAWLGDIPINWKISRVKNEFISLNNKRVPLSSSERGKMTLRLFDYYGASGIIDKVDDYIFDDELLLIAEDGANLVLRNLPLAIIANGKFWVNNHAHILKPKHGNIHYLAHVMESLNYQPWISGAAQPKLTLDRLMSIPIFVPNHDEQNQLLIWINEKTSPIIQQINKFKNEIFLLQEYRTRLLADVVTGKLDVREAAAQLPEELIEEEIDVEESEIEDEEELQEELEP